MQAGTLAELLSGAKETDLPQLLTANSTQKRWVKFAACRTQSFLLTQSVRKVFCALSICAQMESGLAATGHWDHRLCQQPRLQCYWQKNSCCNNSLEPSVPHKRL